MPSYLTKPRKGIMLCYPFEERRILGQMNARYKWQWPVAVQPKLDGERCRFFFSPEGGTWLGLSSTEEPISISVPHIVKALNASSVPKSAELDGELYVHGWTFEQVHSVCSRRKNLHEDHEAMQYHVFDTVSQAPYMKRYPETALYVKMLNQASTVLVPTRLASSMEEIYAILEEYYALDYEGIIVRDLHAPYERKRCSWIMKFKPKKSDTYAIVGVQQEKDKNGELKDSLGAFVCEKDSQAFTVGSGFTQKEREAFWQEYLKNPECFKGISLHLEYQNITSAGVPRFGVYKGILVEGEDDE